MTETDIEAYAKLQGENNVWYVQSLPFYFGRETDKSPEAFLNICMDKKDKTISREYAILRYCDEKKSYALDIKGKKGCYVNKIFYGKDQTCYLRDGDAVSMVNCQFYFLLPQDLNDMQDSSSMKRTVTNELENDSKRVETS